MVEQQLGFDFLPRVRSDRIGFLPCSGREVRQLSGRSGRTRDLESRTGPSVADLAIFGQMQMLQSGPTPQAAELIRNRPMLVTYLARVDTATRGGGPSAVAA
jgi:hypothetical protein